MGVSLYQGPHFFHNRYLFDTLAAAARRPRTPPTPYFYLTTKQTKTTTTIMERLFRNCTTLPVVLPNGTRVQDVYVVPHYVQTELGMDPDQIWNDLQTLPQEPICPHQAQTVPPIVYKPYTARLVSGRHHALQYRGHALGRHKCWFQTNIQYDGYCYKNL